MNYGANPSVIHSGSITGLTNNPASFLNIDLQPTPADTFMYQDAGDYVSATNDPFDNHSFHYVPGMDMQVAVVGGVTTFVGNAPWIPFGVAGPDATYMQSDHDLGRHPNQAINAVMVDGHAVTEQKSFILDAAESVYGGNNPVTSNTVAWWYYIGGYTAP
jgi:prepilin-type processing-associated H-X9-DG protein